MEPSDLLRSMVSVFERLEVPYLVTGSMATIAYGEPRFTNDIDLVADMKAPHIEPFCATPPHRHRVVTQHDCGTRAGLGFFNRKAVAARRSNGS